MTRYYFKPQPILTIITLVGLIVLVKLGLWQKQRLAWKTELLASVEAAVTAPAFQSFDAIAVSIDNSSFVEFRRVDISANLASMDAPFFVFTGRNRDVSWRQFQIAQNMGHYAFADIDIVPDEARDEIKVKTGAIRLIGYVRTQAWQESPRTQSSPEANRWFGFNPMTKTDDWSVNSPHNIDMRFFIETVEGVKDGDDLPPKQPEIANNHFDYMLTWFSLAFILLVFYMLIHFRDGRAGRRVTGDSV
ncbi:MAG: SURF1 family cytochrome oxidase biogenesis protein [Maricaulaceae bacterium]